MIKIALSLFAAALALFLSAEAASLSGLVGPIKLFYDIGAGLLLASFLAILCSLLLLVGKQIGAGLRRYFSAFERRQRRYWFTLGRLEQERRLVIQRARQCRYLHEAERKRLIRANDRKHSLSLAKAIDRDLTLAKARVPLSQLKAWRELNKQYRRRANIEGLISLQQTIMAYR